MLIQHILTERLIREIFDNPEFVRRNVIAAEVEKVMLAMTSQSFDRNTYLKELDRFYVAIEHAARTMTDWSDKQYFLNTVYERFFQGYSVKLADTMGIVYKTDKCGIADKRKICGWQSEAVLKVLAC